MADKVKGITVEFRGDTTQLEKALRTVKSEARSIDQELRQVNNSLKFNPKNTELLAQKQKLLKDKVAQTSKSLTELKDIQKQMDAKGVDKNSAEYQRLRREIIATQSKLDHFNGELKKTALMANKVHRLGGAFKEAGAKIEGAGQKLRGLSTAAGLVVAALGGVTYKAGQMADDLNTLSKQTGISTQQLQLYAASADLVDVSVESIAKAQQKLKRNMLGALDGTNDQAQYFQELGVEITNADGSMRDAQDVFNDTVKALGKMENETQRDAYAMALMGKSASDLNPLIEDGGATYEKVSKMMKKYGLEPVSQEDLDRANEFNDAIDTIKLVVTQAIQIVGTKIAGYLVPLMDRLVKKISEISRWFGGLSGEVLAKLGAVLGAVALLSPALIVLGKIISGLGMAIQTGVKVVGGLSKALAFLAANPVALVVAAIAALVAAFVILWNKSDKFRTFFINLWTNIKERITAIVTSLKNAWDGLKAKITAISAAFKAAKASIVSAWQGLPDTFRRIWNSIGGGLKNLGAKIGNAVTGAIKSGINAVIQTVENIVNKAINLVNSAIKLANKLLGVNVGLVGALHLPRLAKGGVLNGAQTIIAGEAGPEAIIPLDRLFAQMDKMAAQITEGTGGGPVVVNVYGAEGQSISDLAAAVERRLIEAQKRRRLAWQ